jgi:hypothetical protein
MVLFLLYLSWIVVPFATSACKTFILSADAGHSRYADHFSTFLSIHLAKKNSSRATLYLWPYLYSILLPRMITMQFKIALKYIVCEITTQFGWPSIASNDVGLWAWESEFGFTKTRENYRPDEQLSSSQERFYTRERKVYYECTHKRRL